MKILIVEDEIRIREGIQSLIKKIAPEDEIVGEAGTGKEGADKYFELQPDFIITDIKMPQMDGLEMLTEIDRKGKQAKAIVISAYSEFEYARRAMRLGVTEYILKPISISEFEKSIEQVKRQVLSDKEKKPPQIGTLSQTFHEILNGQIDIVPEITEYLKNKYDIDSYQNFFINCIYLGHQFDEGKDRIGKKLSLALSTYGGVSFTEFASNSRKAIIVIYYHYADSHDLERWIQYQLLKHFADDVTMGCIEVDGIGHIKEGIDMLYPYLEWNISFQEDILISYPKITQVQTSLCIYPLELERDVKVAICSMEQDKVENIINSFQAYLSNGQVYDPKEIKENYVRFIWSIIGTAKEMNCIDEEIDRQKILGSIMGAKTRGELFDALKQIYSMLRLSKENIETSQLMVNRANGLIHEFYQNGITLDEIAAKLHITPEYLGTLFHKEMGVTFSTYLRNYRISKAKELLCSTDLKLYEISERVGYTDSKYFSKVFKETVGQLPADYRKLYQ